MQYANVALEGDVYRYINPAIVEPPPGMVYTAVHECRKAKLQIDTHILTVRFSKTSSK